LVTLVEGVNRILFDSIYPLKTRVHIKFESTARSNKLNVFFSELYRSSWVHSYSYVLFLKTEVEVPDFSLLVLRFIPLIF